MSDVPLISLCCRHRHHLYVNEQATVGEMTDLRLTFQTLCDADALRMQSLDISDIQLFHIFCIKQYLYIFEFVRILSVVNCIQIFILTSACKQLF